MVGFIKKVMSGIAYGFGFGIGNTIWKLIQGIILLYIVWCGAVFGLHRLGFSIERLPNLPSLAMFGDWLRDILKRLM